MPIEDGPGSADSRILELEERVRILEEWKSEVMQVNPRLDMVLDPTPRGEASDE
jgi:hypothetical protein